MIFKRGVSPHLLLVYLKIDDADKQFFKSYNRKYCSYQRVL